MTDPTTGRENDDALGSALRGMPRPAVDAALRETHIAAALGELTATGADAPSNVVSLASRRRPMRALLGAVAAAGLFAVGLGVGRAGNSDAPANTAPARNAAIAKNACTDLAALGLPNDAVAIAGSAAVAVYRFSADGVDEVVAVDLGTCSVITRINLAKTDNGG